MARPVSLTAALFACALFLGVAGCGASEPGKQTVSTDPAPGQPPNPRVLIETGKGDITVELFPGNAPLTVRNFLDYANAGFYDGLIFHRVIPGFMIQGGGMTSGLAQKSTREPIANEAKNGLRNLRGTLAMARTSDINSATSQFFVNLVDNAFLDHSPGNYGYAVFGRVTAGMDTVDQIAKVKTGRSKGHADVPVDEVVVLSARRIDAA